MDVATCGACEHIQPLHRGGRGTCRLNGCPCTGFTEPASSEAAQLTVMVDPGRHVNPVQWIAIPAAVGAIAGAIVGILIGINL